MCVCVCVHVCVFVCVCVSASSSYVIVEQWYINILKCITLPCNCCVELSTKLLGLCVFEYLLCGELGGCLCVRAYVYVLRHIVFFIVPCTILQTYHNSTTTIHVQLYIIIHYNY
eukprot:GHVQ01031851.1.p1 GENE.GHVQ01031851.1~~GHVQ01031851.1.p1  ORF type:complete len:114 (-),score=8.30 GHVQ01031851.1:238-579(-)